MFLATVLFFGIGSSQLDIHVRRPKLCITSNLLIGIDDQQAVVTTGLSTKSGTMLICGLQRMHQ